MALFGVIAVVVGTIGTAKRGGKLSTLEAENAELKAAFASVQGDVFAFAEDQLKIAAKELGFGTQESNSERITIYAHDERGFFTAFGRFSENPEYRKKSRRNQYEEDAGCIGFAWRNGWYFDPDYPPPQDLDAWVIRCCDDGMTEEVARAIRMKSRLYCGYRIDSRNNDPLAVVVVESTDKGRYIEKDLRDFFGIWGERLREPLERFAPSLPRAATARKAGL